MTKLKPCPFCLCEKAYGHKYDEGFKMRCPACGAEIRRETKQEAVEAWNTRHERTCHASDLYDNVFECSECGCMDTDGIRNYCPDCGARVVKE